MIEKALDKAHSRLRVAQKAVADLPNAKNYDDFCDLWYTFLVASKGVYTLLEKGTKDSAQARQWFGAKNKERKADPLLRYVTEARNDDEHGLEPTTVRVPQQVNFGVGKPGYSRVMVDAFGNTFINTGSAWGVSGNAGNFNPGLRSLDGLPIRNEFHPEHFRLAPVHDRSGNAYAPPTSHLGRDLADRSPANVARLMVQHLERLVVEAEGFRKP